MEMKETSAISWSEYLVLQMEKQAQRCEVTQPVTLENLGLLPLGLTLSSQWTCADFPSS